MSALRVPRVTNARTPYRSREAQREVRREQGSGGQGSETKPHEQLLYSESFAKDILRRADASAWPAA